MSSSSALDGDQQVAVHELHALRRPGRARRVDQREDVLGPELLRPAASTSKSGSAPSTSESGVVPSAPSPSTTITCSRPGSSLRASRICGRNAASHEEHLRVGVGDDVLDLLRRVRVVDRERRRAEHHAARSQMWNSGRLESISATLSPRCTPRPARPPASASTRSRSSAHVIVMSSPLVRIATLSGREAAVMRKCLGDGRRVLRPLGRGAALHVLSTPLLTLCQREATERRSLRPAVGRCRS